MPMTSTNFNWRNTPACVDDGHDYLSVGPGAAPRKLGPRDIGFFFIIISQKQVVEFLCTAPSHW